MPTRQQAVSTGAVESGTTLTQSITVGSGSDRTLVALVRYHTLNHGAGGPTDCTGVTFNTSETFTERAKVQHVYAGAGRNVTVEIWTLDNPTTTTADVVATLDNAVDLVADLTVIEYTGANNGTGTNTGAATGNINDISCTFTTDASDSTIVMGSLDLRGAEDHAAGTDTVEIYDVEILPLGGAFRSCAWEEPATGGSDTINCTFSTAARAAGAAIELLAASGAGGINITPTAGDAVLSTTAPARTTASLRNPPAVDLALSLTAPLAALDHSRLPVAGDLVVSPVAPTAEIAHQRGPSAAALLLSPTAPTRTVARARTPTAGDLALSVTAPTRTTASLRAPAVVDLLVSTTAPTVSVSSAGQISPTTGDLVVSTTAPTRSVMRAADPTAGDLVLSGQQAGRTHAITPDPIAGDLVLSQTAPTATLAHQRTTTAGDLAISLSAPTRSVAIAADPTAGDLVLSLFAPTVTTTTIVLDALQANTWTVTYTSRTWDVEYASRTWTPPYEPRTWDTPVT